MDSASYSPFEESYEAILGSSMSHLPHPPRFPYKKCSDLSSFPVTPPSSAAVLSSPGGERFPANSLLTPLGIHNQSMSGLFTPPGIIASSSEDESAGFNMNGGSRPFSRITSGKSLNARRQNNMRSSNSGASSTGGIHYPAPQVVDHHNMANQYTLQSLVKMALEQSSVAASNGSSFENNHNVMFDYTAAAESLLNCLNNAAVSTSGGVVPLNGSSSASVRASSFKRGAAGTSSSTPERVQSSSSSLESLRRSVTPTCAESSVGASVVSTNPLIQSLLSLPVNQILPCMIQNKVMELATDRNGSRLLQKLLNQASGLAGSAFPGMVSLVIEEVEDYLMTIMCDTYANYMCQQLFQSASGKQRYRLLNKLAPKFIEIAKDRRGTHSLQSLISQISTDEEQELLGSIINGQVEEIALDVHATHVLQQAISCCLGGASVQGPSCACLDFVFIEVAQSIDRLAVDPNALGVVKRCISYSYVRGFSNLFAEKLEHYLFVFVENPYANYAVQHALEVWSSPTASANGTINLCERIISKMSDKIAPMALHKFASNVAEMAIKSSTPATRYSLIELLNYNEDSRVISLMRSPFGVFVMGTAIKFADNFNQKQALISAVSKNLKKIPDGRNKLKWEKLISDCCCSAPRLFLNSTTTH